MSLSPLMIFLIGVVSTILLAAFVYVTIRGITRPPPPDVPVDQQLDQTDAVFDSKRPIRVLLAIDGSPSSLAAVSEVASCRLPGDSAIEVLTAIHSRAPVVPDFPPWGFTAVAAHAESVRKQQEHAPELLAAAVKHLRPGRRHLQVTTKVMEGVPKDVILREAAAWGADRIVLGSHGYGTVGRAVLGATAAAVAAAAPCSVLIVRAPTAHQEARVSAS